MTLELYLGPMYAGKTTKMIRMFRANPNAHKVSIDFNTETTHESEGRVVVERMNTHDNVILDNVYTTKRLMKLWCEESYNHQCHEFYRKMAQAQYIYINECQFFPDLRQFVLECLSKDIHVCLYGLDADYKQELFGQTTLLIPYCHYIEKLTGKCHTCRTAESIISYRTTSETQVYLPNSNCYIPLCLKCHKEIR